MSFLICLLCLVKPLVLAKFDPSINKYLQYEIQIYNKPIVNGEYSFCLSGKTRKVSSN